MNHSLYLHCCRNVYYGVSRPFSQNITSLPCRGYFQIYARQAAGNSHSFSNMGVVRNALSQTSRSFPSKGQLSEPVVLYTYTNPKFLRMVNIFGYSFGTFWLFTSYQFSTMRITPRTEKNNLNLPWFARFDLLSSTTSKIVAALLSCFVGCAVLGGAWMYSLRSVSKIVLERGGKAITFTTYNPFTWSMNKYITANLSEMSCQGHRLTNSMVPIKVKNRWMYFLVSSEGTYHNASLFDRTVGLRRNI